MDTSIERIARVLRTDKDTVGNLCKRMEEVTGKEMSAKVMEENDLLMENLLLRLALGKSV